MMTGINDAISFVASSNNYPKLTTISIYIKLISLKSITTKATNKPVSTLAHLYQALWKNMAMWHFNGLQLL